MKLFLLFFLLLSAQFAQATHLSGGYIQAKPFSENALSYEITVTLYLNEVTGKVAAYNLESLTLCFGDGTIGTVYRSARTFFTNKQFAKSFFNQIAL